MDATSGVGAFVYLYRFGVATSGTVRDSAPTHRLQGRLPVVGIASALRGHVVRTRAVEADTRSLYVSSASVASSLSSSSSSSSSLSPNRFDKTASAASVLLGLEDPLPLPLPPPLAAWEIADGLDAVVVAALEARLVLPQYRPLKLRLAEHEMGGVSGIGPLVLTPSDAVCFRSQFFLPWVSGAGLLLWLGFPLPARVSRSLETNCW
mmetsp:Transcript_26990/g.74199  ORF Transcript_26990/g.74199 Transcript_26990/m.74199 type:complete len:207 (+) Transcript_26990:62-682(+)